MGEQVKKYLRKIEGTCVHANTHVLEGSMKCNGHRREWRVKMRFFHVVEPVSQVLIRVTSAKPS